MAVKLPPGWVHTPSKPATRCFECGHCEPVKHGSLRSPDGREWPLVGNSGATQERDMVLAIIGANPDTTKEGTTDAT